MNETPKGLRAHIAIVGRTNSGKSSFLNALAKQDVSIVSNQPGTTTDPVEKTMELHPLGPVVWLDTAGMDDLSELGERRAARSLEIINRSNAAVLICRNGEWTEAEAKLAKLLQEKRIPFLILRNAFREKSGEGAGQALQDGAAWKSANGIAPQISVLDAAISEGLDAGAVASALKDLLDVEAEMGATIAADLVPKGGVCLLVAPLDSGAPKGRLILPQTLVIRDLLDHERLPMATTPEQFAAALAALSRPPALVVCDSQVVKAIADAAPREIPLTTFSILMARFKGDLVKFAKGAKALETLAPGDSALIQEACSHYPQPDDIGRVKLPRLLKKAAGGDLNLEWRAGKEVARYEKDYKVIIHCGACVITRAQMLARAEEAEKAAIPITNYGMTISFVQGVLERVLEPFPEALAAFRKGEA